MKLPGNMTGILYLAVVASTSLDVFLFATEFLAYSLLEPTGSFTSSTVVFLTSCFKSITLSCIFFTVAVFSSQILTPVRYGDVFLGLCMFSVGLTTAWKSYGIALNVLKLVCYLLLTIFYVVVLLLAHIFSAFCMIIDRLLKSFVFEIQSGRYTSSADTVAEHSNLSMCLKTVELLFGFGVIACIVLLLYKSYSKRTEIITHLEMYSKKFEPKLLRCVKTVWKVTPLPCQNAIRKQVSFILSLLSTEKTEKCVVCFEREKSVIFFPCKHLCVCAECAADLALEGKRSLCPLCKNEIDNTVVIFT